MGRSDVGPIASRVRLDESSRGKIVVGKSTVLFQFVVPPPRPSPPQLPLSTKGRQIDWTLTVIAAFSFLVHFGVIGAMFSDWADPVVASEDNVVSIIDMTHKLPQTMVVEDHETPATTPSETPSHDKPSANVSHDRPNAQQSSEARAAALANEAEAMQMSLLIAMGGKVAVEGALKRPDVPIGNLDGVDRVDSKDHELRLATNGLPAPTVPGLRHLGDSHSHEGTTIERNVDGPKFDITTSIPEFPHGPDVNIEGAIARLRPSFRSCYVRKGLDVDPTMEGKLVIEITIAANGDVGDVKKVEGSGLSSAVEQCIIERAHNASFNAPGGTGTHARVPIIFRQQH
jgi:hypothetical protein